MVNCIQRRMELLDQVLEAEAEVAKHVDTGCENLILFRDIHPCVRHNTVCDPLLSSGRALELESASPSIFVHANKADNTGLSS